MLTASKETKNKPRAELSVDDSEILLGSFLRADEEHLCQQENVAVEKQDESLRWLLVLLKLNLVYRKKIRDHVGHWDS